MKNCFLQKIQQPSNATEEFHKKDTKLNINILHGTHLLHLFLKMAKTSTLSILSECFTSYDVARFKTPIKDKLK